MTQKAMVFAYEYAKDMDYGRALKASGYASGSAPLDQPEVKELVAKLLVRRLRRLELDGDWVASQLAEIVAEARAQKKLGTAVDALKVLAAMNGQAKGKEPKEKSLAVLFGSVAPALEGRNG